MVAEVRIKIKNYDALMMAWKSAPGNLTKGVHQAIQKTVLKIEAAAKREAPVNKQSGGGNLRQSIKSGMMGIASGKVEVGVDYGIYVHEGTRPHMIRARGNYTLQNKSTQEVFGRLVHHPGTRANPFLQRAVDKSRGEIDNYFMDALNHIFK